MKLYDRATGTEKVTDHNGTHHHAQNYSTAIITTVGELKDMWRLAMQHGVRPYDTVSFEDFLTSKGIKNI